MKCEAIICYSLCVNVRFITKYKKLNIIIFTHTKYDIIVLLEESTKNILHF